jgi:xanthosine utilization system XapX-like protein
LRIAPFVVGRVPYAAAVMSPAPGVAGPTPTSSAVSAPGPGVLGRLRLAGRLRFQEPSDASRRAGRALGAIWGGAVGAVTGFVMGLPVFGIGGLIGLAFGGSCGAATGSRTGYREGVGQTAALVAGMAAGAAVAFAMCPAGSFPLSALAGVVGSWVGYHVAHRGTRLARLMSATGNPVQYFKATRVMRGLPGGGGRTAFTLDAMREMSKPVGAETEAERVAFLKELLAARDEAALARPQGEGDEHPIIYVDEPYEALDDYRALLASSRGASLTEARAVWVSLRDELTVDSFRRPDIIRRLCDGINDRTYFPLGLAEASRAFITEHAQTKNPDKAFAAVAAAAAAESNRGQLARQRWAYVAEQLASAST